VKLFTFIAAKTLY